VKAKPKATGRGGARPGAGRPRKPSAFEIATERQADADSTEAGSDVAASDFTGLALRALEQILRFSQNDGARVAAAKEVLSRADAETAAPEGKKAQAKEASDRLLSEGGRFSAPPPPPGSKKLN
jgi:hypothetical protein